MLGLIPLVSVFVALRYQEWWALTFALVLSPWPFLIRSGGQFQASPVPRFRSFKGWKLGSRWVRWGTWHAIRTGDRFVLNHHKESLMNRRGAPRASGVEYWDLVCIRDDKHEVWHPFASRKRGEAATVALIEAT